MAEVCAVCGKEIRIPYKGRGQSVCGKCQYLIYVNDWKKCPLCGSKADFEPRGLNKNYLRCRNCSAEWEVEIKFRGEPEKISLHKPSADGRGEHLKGVSQPFNWWVKTDLAKEEERRKEEVKEAPREMPCPVCGSLMKRGWASWTCKVCNNVWGFTENKYPKIDERKLQKQKAKYEERIRKERERREVERGLEEVEVTPRVAVKETKKDLITKLDERLARGEISEETYKTVLARLEKRPEVRLCPKCGSELEADAEFCTQCGIKIERVKERRGKKK